MIKIGDTIVYKASGTTMSFFWLCDIQDDYLLFFDWYANPRKASSDDYWRISTNWFKENVNEGLIEVFSSLPLDKYGDVFERQARERNRQ